MIVENSLKFPLDNRRGLCYIVVIQRHKGDKTMYGKITFDSAKELATFLKEFTGSTALFTVQSDGGKYTLQFTGGY